MQLYERSTALRLLDTLLRGAADGGRVGLIAGEAGIGKSSVVKAFAAACGGRAVVLWGACDPLVTPRALGPLHDIARQTGGALAEAVAAGAGQAELFSALVAELSGPRQRPPRVMVVEDAHWADEATLDLLVFLGRRIERLPALLLVTYREDEVGTEHALRAALASVPRSAVTPVPVTPLSAACVAGLAADHGRSGAEIFQLTGGNPLLVTELLAADRALPATVGDLTRARLRRLSAAAREVAHLVSVIPTSAEAAVLAGAEDAVDECVAGGVLVARGDMMAYRHELLRRAVEESLTPPRRAALHRLALTRLARIEGTDPARLVHHARLGGDHAELVRFGPRAAAGAAAQGAHREAVAHFRAVRPHAAMLPEGDRINLLESYAEQAYLAGMASEGLEPVTAAVAERERLGDPFALGESLRRLSRLAWWSAQAEQARDAADRAVRVLAPLGPSRALGMAYSNLAQLHMLSHRMAEAVEWGERARRLADQLDDPATSVHASINIGTARMFADPTEGQATLRAAHTTAARAGHVDDAARALVNLTTCHEQVGDYATAHAVAEEALRYADTHELGGYVQYLLGVRAVLRVGRGDWDGALSDAAESLDRASVASVAIVPALVAKGRVDAARGGDAAATLTRAVDAASATGELQRMAPVCAAWAEFHLLNGEAEAAARQLRPALRLAVDRGHPWFADELAFWLWRATDEPAPPVAASTPADRPYRLLMSGDWAGAAALWRARGDAYRAVQALAFGDRAAAVAALRELDRLNAVRAAQSLRAALRGRGVPGVPRGPRPASAANAAGLTPRQAQVLGLLAEGFTNAEIASRLTLAPKTIEHHVAAVLDKLGATTRGQAVAAARRRHLIG
ncbi:AAA family ATPase [Verrucosispora sp. WMMA2121]|uniref:ATP-binding protein n=1 Tax=Verrucosispora sp. WMMA2121 TaxID=3015164 RepID=UPI0022B699BF|nr:AAA family ATPase [Verrucosispora sp. WMMA2121]MCZ7423274.1 AAA family ATPase [Verrucosispora sp. WMMA2121]